MLQTPVSEKYDDLVSLAYLGVNEAKPWQSFVECLSELAHVRDATVLISTVKEPGNGFAVTSDHAPHLTQDYVHKVFSTEFMQTVNQMEIPTPTQLNHLPTLRSLENTDLYELYLKPYDIQRVMVVDVWRDPMLLVRLSVERTPRHGEFDANDHLLLQRAAKHLARSMNLRSTLQQMRSTDQFYQQAMDQLGVSTLFLNAAGQVVHTNQTGSELLARRNGLCLRDGKPVVSEGRSGEQFRTLLRSLLGNSDVTPQGMRLLDDHGASLLEIVGRRLPGNAALEPNTPVVVLLVTTCREQPRDPSPDLLRDLYGFTGCEARLAKLLAQGYSTAEASAILSVSTNTVKTHLKGIFEKMGYNKQSQIVAALKNSPSRLM